MFAVHVEKLTQAHLKKDATRLPLPVPARLAAPHCHSRNPRQSSPSRGMLMRSLQNSSKNENKRFHVMTQSKFLFHFLSLSLSLLGREPLKQRQCQFKALSRAEGKGTAQAGGGRKRKKNGHEGQCIHLTLGRKGPFSSAYGTNLVKVE